MVNVIEIKTESVTKKDVIEIVNKSFGLSKESMELFTEKVMNPDIPKEYSHFGLDENHRKYWEIPIAFREFMDKGWDELRYSAPYFCKKYSLTYEDYYNNRVKVGENSYIKLFKALYDYALNNINAAYVSYPGLLEFMKNPSSILRDYYKEEDRRKKLRLEEFFDVFVSIYARNNSIEKIKDISLEEIEDYYKHYIKTQVIELTETIGRKALPKKEELYLVFTKNPADMLFCSTGETWTSCLNLNSSYSYWAGLPMAIIDKNRGMFYITNKEKKFINLKSFGVEGENIEKTLDKIMLRSWSLIFVGPNSTPFIDFVKFYPNDINSDKIIEFLIKSGEEETLLRKPRFTENFASKYNLTILEDINGDAPYLYQDNSSILKNLEGSFSLLKEAPGCRQGTAHIKNKEVFCTFPYANINGEGLTHLVRNNSIIPKFCNKKYMYACESCGRSYVSVSLRDNGEYLCDYCYEGEQENENICCCCGDPIEEGESIEFRNEVFCENCFEEETIECESCGNREYREDSHYVESSSMTICEECYDNRLSECLIDGELYFTDDMTFLESYNEFVANINLDRLKICPNCNNYTLDEDFDEEKNMCAFCVEEARHFEAS